MRRLGIALFAVYAFFAFAYGHSTPQDVSPITAHQTTRGTP